MRLSACRIFAVMTCLLSLAFFERAQVRRAQVGRCFTQRRSPLPAGAPRARPLRASWHQHPQTRGLDAGGGEPRWMWRWGG